MGNPVPVETMILRCAPRLKGVGLPEKVLIEKATFEMGSVGVDLLRLGAGKSIRVEIMLSNTSGWARDQGSLREAQSPRFP